MPGCAAGGERSLYCIWGKSQGVFGREEGSPGAKLPCFAGVTLSSSRGLRRPQLSQCIKKGLKAAQWL